MFTQVCKAWCAYVAADVAFWRQCCLRLGVHKNGAALVTNRQQFFHCMQQACKFVLPLANSMLQAEKWQSLFANYEQGKQSDAKRAKLIVKVVPLGAAHVGVSSLLYGMLGWSKQHDTEAPVPSAFDYVLLNYWY